MKRLLAVLLAFMLLLSSVSCKRRHDEDDIALTDTTTSSGASHIPSDISALEEIPEEVAENEVTEVPDSQPQEKPENITTPKTCEPEPAEPQPDKNGTGISDTPTVPENELFGKALREIYPNDSITEKGNEFFVTRNIGRYNYADYIGYYYDSPTNAAYSYWFTCDNDDFRFGLNRPKPYIYEQKRDKASDSAYVQRSLRSLYRDETSLYPDDTIIVRAKIADGDSIQRLTYELTGDKYMMTEAYTEVPLEILEVFYGDAEAGDTIGYMSHGYMYKKISKKDGQYFGEDREITWKTMAPNTLKDKECYIFLKKSASESVVEGRPLYSKLFIINVEDAPRYTFADPNDTLFFCPIGEGLDYYFEYYFNVYCIRREDNDSEKDLLLDCAYNNRSYAEYMVKNGIETEKYQKYLDQTKNLYRASLSKIKRFLDKEQIEAVERIMSRRDAKETIQ